MTGAASVLAGAYTRELSERGFQEDPAQLAVIARLEDLRLRLLASAERRSSRRSRWLPRLGARPRVEPVPGLYVWGTVGRGKTWLMDLFYESLPFPQRRRRHFHRFMHEAHAQLARLRNRANPLDELAAQIAAESWVLCFDELYVSDIADAMILGGLFDGLVRHGVTLVFTSNVPPRELYRDGLQRARFVPAIELIERHTEVIAMGGQFDYRLRQLTSAGTYLRAGDPDTRGRMEALFHELADGPGHGPGTIEIEGRPVSVVRESENVAWFDFVALCEGPRSQDDYIEIAREYQCVLVSDVPAMDEQADDAARRFIALVDEFYDRNVALVLSAAAEPHALYAGTRLRHAFERTASRLTEMQSAAYLAREHRA
jgi:cell division protein ZapE